MLGGLPEAAVDAFLEQAGPDAETSLLVAELRQLGGALGRPAEGAGALDRLDAAFVAFGVAMAATPEAAVRGDADATALVGALAPWDNGRTYLNFAERPVDTRTAYDASAWRQLAGIRSAVDPHGNFAANHPVPRLWENDRATT